MDQVMVDVAAIGDNITDCFVDRGQMYPGGNAVNVAVQAARSGARSAYIGAIGDDARGRQLKEALVAEGVNVERLHILTGGTAYVDVRHVDGDRIFETVDRGVSLLQPSPDDLAFAGGARIAHSTYCSGLEGTLELLARSTHVSFDFDTHLADDYALNLMPHVWAAEFSASNLSDKECESLLGWAGSHGAVHAVATRAHRGAMHFDGEQFSSAHGLSIDPVDTLGAGDAFIGRALVGLVKAESAAVLLPAAIAAASRACESEGGFGHGAPLLVADDPNERSKGTVGRDGTSGRDNVDAEFNADAGAS
jgi:fructoselysine 6-kinase